MPLGMLLKNSKTAKLFLKQNSIENSKNDFVHLTSLTTGQNGLMHNIFKLRMVNDLIFIITCHITKNDMLNTYYDLS